MRRRLLNHATCLSLLLAAAACLMWARSQSVSEAWCFTPEQFPRRRCEEVPEVRGWQRWRLVASMDGRLVYADVYERVYRGLPDRTIVGYRRVRFMPPDWDLHEHGDRRHIRVARVSWLVPAFAGLVLPAVGMWLHRRKPRGPTFEVVTPA